MPHLNFKPFSARSRAFRADEVQRLKREMARRADYFGGRFISLLAMDEPGRTNEMNQWFQFAFPSAEDPATLWNATFLTAKKEFWEEANRLAYDRAQVMLDDAGIVEEFDIKAWMESLNSDEPPKTYDVFDGRTMDEQVKLITAGIVRTEPPEIHEHFELDPRYEHGIGLKMVLDVDHIDKAAIEAAIDRFVAAGEQDWKSPDPVPRERLPQVAQHEAFEYEIQVESRDLLPR